jgi:ABC-2 type transport system ATP-binding protein
VSARGLEFRNVSFSYLPETPVFERLDLTIGPGLTLVLGPNGNGKSTLLKIAAGVEKPDAGSVTVNGFDLWAREVEARRDLAYVPEQPDVTPYASVGTVLRLVCRLRSVPEERVGEALAEVGEEALGGRSIRELSNGQRRRVLLAAARIGSPRTLLLDEPLASVDRGTRARIREWITGASRGGGLAMVVTHELEPFVEAATAAVALVRGRARSYPTLPEDLAERRDLLERLAGGSASGAAE